MDTSVIDYLWSPYLGMDALISKADAIQRVQKISTGHLRPTSKNPVDHTMNSIVKGTSIPKSLKDTHKLNNASNYEHLKNKKLRIQLTRQSEQTVRARALVQDAEMLLMEDVGGIEVEGELDRTWRVGQSEVVQSAGQEAAKGRREYKLDGGPYVSKYTRNGRCIQNHFYPATRRTDDSARHLAIAGRSGHLATFDWQTGALHTELQVQETCRDITYVS